MKVIHHHLLSVNLTKKKAGKLDPMTGLFQYRTNKSPEWLQIVVSISPLLASRMQTRRKREKLPVNVPYVGHEFITTFNSPQYADSPFRLVKFTPNGKSDIPENYQLEAVDEWGTSVFDEDLDEVIGYKNGFRKLIHYYRKEKRIIIKMLEDLEEGTVIAKPNLQRIPV